MYNTTKLAPTCKGRFTHIIHGFHLGTVFSTTAYRVSISFECGHISNLDSIPMWNAYRISIPFEWGRISSFAYVRTRMRIESRFHFNEDCIPSRFHSNVDLLPGCDYDETSSLCTPNVCHSLIRSLPFLLGKPSFLLNTQEMAIDQGVLTSTSFSPSLPYYKENQSNIKVKPHG